MSTPQLYCTFRVADRLFGVPIRTVREVTTETTCTRIPHAPAEVAGYVNIRGHIHLALDLRRLLGLPPGANGQHRRLVLFQAGVGTAFGVLVDEVGDIVSVDDTHAEDLTPASGDLASCLTNCWRFSIPGGFSPWWNRLSPHIPDDRLRDISDLPRPTVS